MPQFLDLENGDETLVSVKGVIGRRVLRTTSALKLLAVESNGHLNNGHLQMSTKELGIKRIFCALLNLMVCGRHDTPSSVLLALLHCHLGPAPAAPGIVATKKGN